ncbi:hypothetical protein GCM10028806_57140 [Spirosoma terrae]|uniref:SGNH/GDSL hydrolase family protein n=1 Tax=Spirosoma terrae TaxID=1968276 RepID=A0A6L9LBP6_9BACT|nr:hypothetical protein [Spirosoma terrae]NDU97936.1 hypothetical protein [Spirosoma terrae]
MNGFIKFGYCTAALIVVSIVLYFYMRMIWDIQEFPSITFVLGWLIALCVISYALVYGKAWAKGTVLSILSFAFTWLVLEGLCALVIRIKDGPGPDLVETVANKSDATQRNAKKYTLIHYDQLGMSRPAPGEYTIEYALKGGKKADVTYHVDSLSRRLTPFNPKNATGKYALFMGCSFTYGESVADTNTLPYYFGEQTGYRPYNYGVSGHSPSQMLAILQRVNIRRQIAEKDGIALYTFIDDHLARTTPSTKWADLSAGYLPYVNPKTLVVEGTYAQKHPVRIKLIRWLHTSNVAKLFKVSFPKKYSIEQYQQFVNIVGKAKELYQKQFGNDNFYVVVFPMYRLDPKLRELFEKANLKLLDYSALLTWNTAYDGMHPDAQAFRQVAKKIAQDLQVKPEKVVAAAE